MNAARTVPTVRRNASAMAGMLMLLLRGRHASVLQVDANAAALVRLCAAFDIASVTFDYLI